MRRASDWHGTKYGHGNDPPNALGTPTSSLSQIIDIATGEKPDGDPTPEEQGKDSAAGGVGQKGRCSTGGEDDAQAPKGDC
jgi:hypothetical protein